MERLNIAVYDEATGTVIEREMTDAEHAEFWAANTPAEAVTEEDPVTEEAPPVDNE